MDVGRETKTWREAGVLQLSIRVLSAVFSSGCNASQRGPPFVTQQGFVKQTPLCVWLLCQESKTCVYIRCISIISVKKNTEKKIKENVK